MTLAQWLKRQGIGQGRFAMKVGTSQSQVSRLASGERVPDLRLALAIERATQGSVPVAIWTSPARGKKRLSAPVE